MEDAEVMLGTAAVFKVKVVVGSETSRELPVVSLEL